MGEARLPQGANSKEDEASRLLEGVRILDFTFQGAGPYATMLLGLLGADIIKVESATRPDPTRGRENRPYLRSLLFDDVNIGKRSIALNMKTDSGLQVARSLAGRCCAVVDCFRPGVMQRWGLDHKSLRVEHPGIVSASLSATGSTGPLAQLPGYAGIFNAMGGLGALTGYPGGPPTELRTSVDMRVGAMFAVGVMGALIRARLSGHGEFVDFSAVEAVAMLCGEYLLSESLSPGSVPLRLGDRDDEHAPCGVYRAADGQWIALTILSDKDWQCFSEMLTADGALLPEGLETAEDRAAHGDELDLAIGRWVGRHETWEILEAAQETEVAAGTVMDARELCKDPDLTTEEFLLSVPSSADGRQVGVCGAPWAVNGTRPGTTPAPQLGEHTSSVLAEVLNLPPAQVAQLRAEGALL